MIPSSIVSMTFYPSVYLVTQSCLTLCDPMDCSLPVLCPWNSPGKNTGVGCHLPLEGIFPTQGLNQSLLCLRHCRWILYPLGHYVSGKFIYNVLQSFNNYYETISLSRKKETVKTALNYIVLKEHTLTFMEINHMWITKVSRNFNKWK